MQSKTESPEAASFEWAGEEAQPFTPEYQVPPAPNTLADALKGKIWPLALKLAIAAGLRDENKLTNLIFFARHPELAPGRVDPKDPHFKQLSAEWSNIQNGEVWAAIQAASENTSLAVSGPVVCDLDRQFWSQRGKQFKSLVEDAARKVDLNPGFLAAVLVVEGTYQQSSARDTFLSPRKIDSYTIGVDDFYDMRFALAASVPAYKDVHWDKKQKPVVHLNDAKDPREVKTILFDSGPDGLLAVAVYLKYREVRLRQEAKKLGADFDALPFETRLALTRIGMAAGIGGTMPFLKSALNGHDIFVRKNIPVVIYQTARNATVRTAQALHLSEWIFGVSALVTTQHEFEAVGQNGEYRSPRRPPRDADPPPVPDRLVYEFEGHEPGWSPRFETETVPGEYENEALNSGQLDENLWRTFTRCPTQ